MDFVPRKKPVHLVKNFHEVPAKKRDETLLGSEKVDGTYAFLRQGICYSRTGKPYKSGFYLAEKANRIMPHHVIIGEFMLYNDAGVALSVNDISGSFRRDCGCREAFFVVHDCIPIHDFDGGECLIPFAARIDQASPLYKNPRFIENDQVVLHGEEMVELFAQDIIDSGGEGAVFKQIDGIWQAGKKNEVQMKIKKGVSYDLEVVGWELGKAEGKYANTLGKLLCRWTGDRVVRCSGMSDAQRNAWFADEGLIVGSIVKVDGMCLTLDGMIREPRFKEVRNDKDTADV